MNGLHQFFTPVDWAVVFGYLILTTIVGHQMRGKQASIKDFFLGGRSLPWPAVTGSIIATEISGVTFIGVPGAVMALQGDFTYLQWAVGSIVARIIVGLFFVKVFYEKDIYSPYDFMGNRLGEGVKKLATVLFTVGSILAQSVRVLVAALPLKIVTPLPFEWCIVIIGLFAIGWTLMGGMRTVIWTDVMQFVLFIVGGIVALVWMVSGFANGWETLISTASTAQNFDGTVVDKLRVFNFDTDPALQFTFWVAIFAVPFLNLNAFGVDQLNAQRMFCCKNPSDAKKAIIWSSFGQLVTLLMLFVGAALFVFYQKNPPTDPLIMEALKWQGGQPGEPDNVFPVWIVTELPTALRGLILAGIFAAAISSLDSILAALSQTTLALLHKTDREHSEEEHAKLVKLSRILVLVWGIFLTGFTFILHIVKEKTDVNILPLAFGMTAYTVGPLLGMFLVALLGKGRGSVQGLIIGAIISVVLVMFVRTDVWILFMTDGLAEFLAQLPTYDLKVTDAGKTIIPKLAYAWMWPITTIITIGFGLALKRTEVKDA
ncbi:MAG: sodium/solute symporter [Verrucomicrobiales bacterium]|nr:sodium/solute symporter [Verrucomicrobiales bacterium]